MHYGSVDGDFLIRLCIALGLGLILGIERELKHKSIGLKTTTTICVASFLLTYISIEAAYSLPKIAGIQLDPMRLAAQIISGVGFIGAGVILIRKNDTVSGLTTSALVWTSATIGIAVGADFSAEAIYTLLSIMFVVEIIPFLMKRIGPKKLQEKRILIRLSLQKGVELAPFLESIKAHQIYIFRMRMREEKGSGLQIRFYMNITKDQEVSEIYYLFKSISGIQTIEVEGID